MVSAEGAPPPDHIGRTISGPGGVAYGTPLGCKSVVAPSPVWRAFDAYHRQPYVTPSGVLNPVMTGYCDTLPRC